MANKPDLTIVILSYNVEELLLNSLRSIENCRTPEDNWQIVIVDNASSDSSIASVHSLFPSVKIIENKKNIGFSAGNNIALRVVNTEYTLLLNPDTVVYPGTIQTVMNYMIKNPQVGAATCRVELPDGKLDYSCHRRFPDPWNSFLYFYSGAFKRLSKYSDNYIPNSIHEIDSLTGAFALIRSRAGREINWLDEDYFWNGEDIDFCFRLKQAGWKIVYIPDVKITHFKGSSSGIRKSGKGVATRETKIRSALSGTKAMRIYYRKHLAPHYPLPFNWFIYSGISLLEVFRLGKVHLTVK